MKRFLTVLLGVMGLVSGAYAQEEEPAFRKTFSVEVGVAPGPLHMQLLFVSPSWETLEALADLGQDTYESDAIRPAVTLSVSIRTWHRWETVITGCASWSHCPVIQYEAFGIDPQGRPRYDLTKGTRIGWKAFSPVYTLTVQERVFWNPRWRTQWYSGFGLGLTTASELVPIPSLVPVGLRLGGSHLYFFAETGFSPFASFVHGGLGWKF